MEVSQLISIRNRGNASNLLLDRYCQIIGNIIALSRLPLLRSVPIFTGPHSKHVLVELFIILYLYGPTLAPNVSQWAILTYQHPPGLHPCSKSELVGLFLFPCAFTDPPSLQERVNGVIFYIIQLLVVFYVNYIYILFIFK